MVATVLGVLMTIVHFYQPILQWALANKWKFLAIPITVVLFGIMTWQGFNKMFGFVADGAQTVGLNLRQTSGWQAMVRAFPGTGKEFMPSLDEGSFLLMPTTMSHSGIEENIDVIRKVDSHVASIPEVSSVVGKWGRVNSALDPAPISMFENTILYKPEFMVDEDGRRLRFKVDDEGNYVLQDGSTYNVERDGYRPIGHQHTRYDLGPAPAAYPDPADHAFYRYAGANRYQGVWSRPANHRNSRPAAGKNIAASTQHQCIFGICRSYCG